MALTDFHPTYLSVDHDGETVIARFTRATLTDDENIEQLGRELFSLVDQFDRRKVVLDLSHVEYVTSSVLGKIITLHRKLHRKDGTLVICHVKGGVEDVMRTSRLLEYFNVARDVDGALARLD